MSTEDRSSHDEAFTDPDEGARAAGRAKDELDDASRRLEDVNWEPFPPHARPSGDERSEDDADPFTAFAEDQLQQRPVVTLVAAVALGWIVGKLLR